MVKPAKASWRTVTQIKVSSGVSCTILAKFTLCSYTRYCKVFMI